MVLDTSTPLHFSPCPHRHVVLATTGGMHCSEGECWDDIHEYLLCLDCNEYLTEAEVRTRWNGDSTEEDCHVDF